MLKNIEVPFLGTDGKLVDLANLSPEDIDLRHIARALSRIPRFCGRTPGVTPYSVAQHCLIGTEIIMAEKEDPDLAAAFLLHDAHEAFIGDIPTPAVDLIARSLNKDDATEFAMSLELAKDEIQQAIHVKALTIPAMEDELAVIEMDRRLLAAEVNWLWSGKAEWQPELPKNAKPIDLFGTHVLPAHEAEYRYLDALETYCGIDGLLREGGET